MVIETYLQCSERERSSKMPLAQDGIKENTHGEVIDPNVPTRYLNENVCRTIGRVQEITKESCKRSHGSTRSRENR